jgi:hypothetical protein
MRIERLIDAFLGATCALRLTTFKLRRRQTGGGPTVKVGDQRLPLAGAYSDRLLGTIFDNLMSHNFTDPDRYWRLSALEQAQLNRGDIKGAFGRAYRLLGKTMTGTSSSAERIRLEMPVTSKEEVLARLAEAVAHSLGRSFEQNDKLRRLVKDLYSPRSDFVHTGHVRESYEVREQALQLMCDV